MAEEQKDFRHLVRIVNTDIDGNKPICHALTRIKGVGFMFANMVCNVTETEKTKRAGTLSETEVKKIEDAIRNPLKYHVPLWMLNRRKDVETGEDKHLVTTDINFVNDNDIKIMKMIRCYKGVRHSMGLPVRGQKTRSNFRKNKGKVLGVKRSKKTGKV